MIANSKNIYGTSNTLLTITNDDINASWLTVTADTITANTTLFVGTTDVMAEIDGKQAAIDDTTDLTVGSLDIDNTSGTNVLNFDSGGQASITGTTDLLTVDIAGTAKLDISPTLTDFKNNILTGSGNLVFTGNVSCNTIGKLATFRDVQVDGNATVVGDLTIDSNTLYVDSTNDHVGINTLTPESALHVVGAREGVPTSVGVHIGHSSGTNYGLELCSLSTAGSSIDFTQPGTNRRGAIGYDNTTNLFTISTNDSQTQLTIVDGTLDAQDNNITTTGNIVAPTFTTTGATQTFSVGGATQLTMSTTTADFQDNAITTTGNMSTSSGTIQGHTITCDNILTTQDLDVDRHATIYGNLTATGGIASFNLTTVDDDLLVGANLFVDKSLNGVSIGTSTSGGNSPQGALSVYGSYTSDSPSKKGIHMSLKNDNIALMQMCSDPDHLSKIEFTTTGIYKEGLIEYNHSDHAMQFEIDSTLVLDLITTQADFQALNIVTTGDITCDVLNHSGVFSTSDVICDNLTCNTLLTMSGAPISSDSAITTTGAVNCGDLNITGSISGFSMQDVYNDNDVEPHITINASHPVTFQGNAAVTNTFQCRNPAGTNVFEVSRDGDITSTDTLFADTSNNGVSIGANVSTNVPQCALSVYGPFITTTPTQKGIHMSLESDNVPIINMCSAAASTGKIQFNQAGSNKGGITYNHSDNGMQFEVENSVLMDLSTSQTMVYGNFTVDTNTLHVDSTNNRVGISTTSPLSALHVVGNRDNSPASVGIHMGATGNDYGIEICSPSNEQMLIDFCTSSGSNDYMARLMYDDSGNNFQINTVNKEIRIDSGTADIDLNGNVVVESGKTFNGNIASTRGQIMSFLGEESSTLAVSAFDFKWGNGQNSSSNFGVCVPCDFKLKKWVYQNNTAGGTDFATGTKIVFRVWSNGVSTGNYLYCDFSDTSRSNTTRRRCQGQFSSSSTSYVPVENTITDAGDGAQISLETITLTGAGTTNNDHRISLFFETLEDM